MRLLAVAVLLAACDDGGVDPITKITGPRVLAILSEPSALPLDGQPVELTVWTVDSEGPRFGDATRLRACTPWKLISDPTRDCIGDDALALAPDDSGRIELSAAALAAAFPAPADAWRAAGPDLRVPIIAEVDVDGQTLLARRDISVVDTAAQRQNPRLAEVQFDGVATRTLRAGQRYVLTATIERASLDERSDTGELETVVCHFYSPAGELSESESECDPIDYVAGTPDATWLFVVVTDETGGMSTASIPLSIE